MKEIKENTFCVHSVRKAMDLLEQISRSPQGCRLSTLANTCGIHAATARNLLRTMEDSGMIERTAEHLYFPGQKLLSALFAGSLTQKNMDHLKKTALRVSAKCGETVCVFVCNEEQINCIFTVSGTRSVIAEAAGGAAALSSEPSSPVKNCFFPGEDGNRKEFSEGPVCGKTCWSLAVPFRSRGCLICTFSILLPAFRATKEIRGRLLAFLKDETDHTAYEWKQDRRMDAVLFR